MDGPEKDGMQRLALAAFACMLPVLAFAAWDQALNFDPCNNIFKNPGTACLESGWGGIAAGLFFAFIGASIAVGAVVRGKRVLGSKVEAGLLCWIGLCMTAVGSAAMYAGFSMVG